MKLKFWFCLTILLIGLGDLVTFLIGNPKFEINPVFLATQSVLLMVFIKFIILGGLCYLIYKANQMSQISQFLYITLGVYVILIQIGGIYANVNTHIEYVANPETTIPLETTVAVKTYMSEIIWQLYFPVIFSLLSFIIWRKCYDKNKIC